MFERRTTIVLGAGASAQFGFPLGADVRAQILSGATELQRYVDKNRTWGLPAINTHNAEDFLKNPFISLARYLASPHASEHLPEDFPWRRSPATALRDFGQDLGRATHDSVDRFVRDNPRHQFIGKALICQNILLRMYAFKDHWLELRSFTDQQMGGRRNWYLQLVNLIREGAKSASDLRDNRLTIVTFNYDLSLEHALAARLHDTEVHKGANYEEVVSVLHVNGMPQRLPERLGDVGKFLLTCGSALRLVDEGASSNLEDVRAQRAR